MCTVQRNKQTSTPLIWNQPRINLRQLHAVLFLFTEEYCSALAFETEVRCSRSTKWILCDNLRLAPFQNKPKCQSALACDDSRQTKPISSRVRNAFLMLSISLSLGRRQDCTQYCNDLETDCHERRCLYHASIQELASPFCSVFIVMMLVGNTRSC